ncbi:MAG: hypothetical protein COS25_01900 [Candidatus Nealsonbacteria bacterium CG02_land_8_20_14_3_00_37_10]|uniref:Uncharacterized protein n=1 Tax=Candidatus Nealsonbacteria bacterium CG02_land_8_20_14_3_00_37_10 TaxID=1974699 RepID=A0A2M7D998_9BACT|nr:MAG: hypothetical protein COS25_01900 [Candidatus Nealsonbacteria bacterium CG02_land_8_20_14_3_00_37_10]
MTGSLKPLAEQKNNKLILSILSREGKIRRGDLYLEVKKLQKQKYGKETSYQVIERDVDRLLKGGLIKVVSGGPRSSVLSLK